MRLGPPVPRPSIRRPVVKRQTNKFVVPIIIVSVIAIFWQMAWMQRNWGEVTRRTDYERMDPDWLDRFRSRFLVEYECNYCTGSGLKPSDDPFGERELCKICQGVGYQTARRFKDSDRMCAQCGGMGRVRDEVGRVDYCSVCGGRGMTEREEEGDVRYPERIVTEDF